MLRILLREATNKKDIYGISILWNFTLRKIFVIQMNGNYIFSIHIIFETFPN